MRGKFLCLLIGIMLLTTFFAMAQPLQKIEMNTSIKDEAQSLSQVDVPIWHEGYKWTYKVHELTMDLSNENQSFLLTITNSDLPMVVTNESGDFYTLSFDTTTSGQGHIITDQGNGPINIEFSFTDLEISGSFLFEKSTLGINDFALSFNNQKFTFNIIEQPFFPFLKWLHKLSLKITSNLDLSLDTSIALLTFPLNTEMAWNQSAINLTANGKVESKILNLIYFINNIASMFKIELLPAEVAELLPVIDINQALTIFLGQNVIYIPKMNNSFYCMNKEDITVPAGTYEAYNITLFGGVGHCFYAPAAGNVILLSGNFHDTLPVLENLNIELLSTTYS